jgi:type II secretory pathway component PulF
MGEGEGGAKPPPRRSQRPEPPRPEYPERPSAKSGGAPVAGATPSSAAPRSPGVRLPSAAPPPFWRRRFGRPGPRDWYFFCHQLRAAIEAGVPVVTALRIVAGSSERDRIRRMSLGIAERIAKGIPFDRAMEGVAVKTPDFMRSLLLAGQRSGTLSNSLAMLERHFRWLIEMRGAVIRVVWYPLALTVFGTAVFIIRDTAIAAVQGRDTRSAFLAAFASYAVPLVGALLAAWVISRGFFVEQARRSIRRVTDRIILFIPGISELARRFAVGSFLEVLAATIEAGMPVVAGYELAMEACPNTVIAERLTTGIRYLRDGEHLSEALRQTRVLDREALAMVASGEISGHGPMLMRKLAGYYDEIIKNLSQVLVRFLAPVFVVGVAVGFFIAPPVLAAVAFALMMLMLAF